MSDRVVVVGAGPNGLVAAVRLAAAGRRVLVLERRDRVGGLSGEFEFHPGYRMPGLLPDLGWVSSRLLTGLGLTPSLLETSAPSLLLAEEDGPGLVLVPGPRQPELALRDPRDADSYLEWQRFITRVRPAVERILHNPPPPLRVDSVQSFTQLGEQWWSLRRLGSHLLLELMRVLPMSVFDWLDDWFSTPLLQEGLAMAGVFGTFAGPRSAGTAANLLLDQSRSGGLLVGGGAALVKALATQARRLGVEIRLDAEVRRLDISKGEVRAVVTRGGQTEAAGAVISCCHPRPTLLDWVPANFLEVTLQKGLRHYRSRGVVALVCLAMARPLQWAGRPGQVFQRVRIGAGKLQDLDRTFDAVKYGLVAPRPHLEIWTPADPARSAPPGHQVALVSVTGAPYRLKGGWSPVRKEKLLRKVLSRLADFVPNISRDLVHAELLAPVDLETRFLLPGGHLCHGEHALDQLFSMRPLPKLAGYQTPIRGLFLGGSGCHPGGGLTGLPGLLAAGSVLKQRL